ncbi:MAG: hypothetical protein L0323_06795 [Planctomycetes bacterium]|nr:hypothetical protein [Planctomycetota bacterium]
MPPGSGALPENQMREFLGVLGRRRAWWIVPTIGGVIVGIALVALVPRKYVVHTTVEILSTYAEELTSRGKETTVDKELATVTNDLRSHARVRKVLEEDMPTPEFGVLTETGKQARIQELIPRIEVGLAPKPRPGGEVVYIHFRDHDKYFAADFANKLRDRWMRETKDRVVGEVRGELQRHNDKLAERVKDYEKAARKVQDHVQRHNLSPQLASGTGIAPRDPVEEEAGALRKTLDSKEDELATAQRNLAVAQKQFDSIEPTILVPPPPPPTLTGPAANPRVAQLFRLIAEGDAKVANLKPAHPMWQRWQELRGQYERELKDLIPAPVKPAPGKAGPIRQRNPRYEEKELEVKGLETRVEGLTAEVEKFRVKAKEASDRAAGRPALYHTCQILQDEREMAEKARAKADQDQEASRALYEKLRDTDPFEVTQAAFPPIRPTEPDPLALFAVSLLVGGGLGLAAAALREYGRTSYRTLEDAARSLPVPVLGAVAWVRTEIERRTIRRRRLAATFATSTAAILLTALFVAYWQKPEFLPSSVSTFLDSIRRSLR